jgi:hypothetical protein
MSFQTPVPGYALTRLADTFSFTMVTQKIMRQALCPPGRHIGGSLAECTTAIHMFGGTKGGWRLTALMIGYPMKLTGRQDSYSMDTQALSRTPSEER